MKHYVVTYDAGWIDIPIAVFPTKKEASTYVKDERWKRSNSYSDYAIMKIYLIGNEEPVWSSEQ